MKTTVRIRRMWRGVVAAAPTISRKPNVVPTFTISAYGLV